MLIVKFQICIQFIKFIENRGANNENIRSQRYRNFFTFVFTHYPHLHLLFLRIIHVRA